MSGEGKDSLNWYGILSGLRIRGVHRVFLKRLAHNDNEKNQIYLGPSLDGRAGTLGARMSWGSSSESKEKRGSTSGKPKSVAHLDWVWIGDGPDAPAPAGHQGDATIQCHRFRLTRLLQEGQIVLSTDFLIR